MLFPTWPPGGDWGPPPTDPPITAGPTLEPTEVFKTPSPTDPPAFPTWPPGGEWGPPPTDPPITAGPTPEPTEPPKTQAPTDLPTTSRPTPEPTEDPKTPAPSPSPTDPPAFPTWPPGGVWGPPPTDLPTTARPTPEPIEAPVAIQPDDGDDGLFESNDPFNGGVVDIDMVRAPRPLSIRFRFGINTSPASGLTSRSIVTGEDGNAVKRDLEVALDELCEGVVRRAFPNASPPSESKTPFTRKLLRLSAPRSGKRGKEEEEEDPATAQRRHSEGGSRLLRVDYDGSRPVTVDDVVSVECPEVISGSCHLVNSTATLTISSDEDPASVEELFVSTVEDNIRSGRFDTILREVNPDSGVLFVGPTGVLGPPLIGPGGGLVPVSVPQGGWENDVPPAGSSSIRAADGDVVNFKIRGDFVTVVSASIGFVALVFLSMLTYRWHKTRRGRYGHEASVQSDEKELIGPDSHPSRALLAYGFDDDMGDGDGSVRVLPSPDPAGGLAVMAARAKVRAKANTSENLHVSDGSPLDEGRERGLPSSSPDIGQAAMAARAKVRAKAQVSKDSHGSDISPLDGRGGGLAGVVARARAKAREDSAHDADLGSTSAADAGTFAAASLSPLGIRPHPDDNFNDEDENENTEGVPRRMSNYQDRDSDSDSDSSDGDGMDVIYSEEYVSLSTIHEENTNTSSTRSTRSPGGSWGKSRSRSVIGLESDGDIPPYLPVVVEAETSEVPKGDDDDNTTEITAIMASAMPEPEGDREDAYSPNDTSRSISSSSNWMAMHGTTADQLGAASELVGFFGESSVDESETADKYRDRSAYLERMLPVTTGAVAADLEEEEYDDSAVKSDDGDRVVNRDVCDVDNDAKAEKNSAASSSDWIDCFGWDSDKSSAPSSANDVRPDSVESATPSSQAMPTYQPSGEQPMEKTPQHFQGGSSGTGSSKVGEYEVGVGINHYERKQALEAALGVGADDYTAATAPMKNLASLPALFPSRDQSIKESKDAQDGAAAIGGKQAAGCNRSPTTEVNVMEHDSMISVAAAPGDIGDSGTSSKAAGVTFVDDCALHVSGMNVDPPAVETEAADDALLLAAMGVSWETRVKGEVWEGRRGGDSEGTDGYSVDESEGSSHPVSVSSTGLSRETGILVEHADASRIVVGGGAFVHLGEAERVVGPNKVLTMTSAGEEEGRHVEAATMVVSNAQTESPGGRSTEKDAGSSHSNASSSSVECFIARDFSQPTEAIALELALGEKHVPNETCREKRINENVTMAIMTEEGRKQASLEAMHMYVLNLAKSPQSSSDEVHGSSVGTISTATGLDTQGLDGVEPWAAVTTDGAGPDRDRQIPFSTWDNSASEDIKKFEQIYALHTSIEAMALAYAQRVDSNATPDNEPLDSDEIDKVFHEQSMEVSGTVGESNYHDSAVREDASNDQSNEEGIQDEEPIVASFKDSALAELQDVRESEGALQEEGLAAEVDGTTTGDALCDKEERHSLQGMKGRPPDPPGGYYDKEAVNKDKRSRRYTSLQSMHASILKLVDKQKMDSSSSSSSGSVVESFVCATREPGNDSSDRTESRKTSVGIAAEAEPPMDGDAGTSAGSYVDNDEDDCVSQEREEAENEKQDSNSESDDGWGGMGQLTSRLATEMLLTKDVTGPNSDKEEVAKEEHVYLAQRMDEVVSEEEFFDQLDDRWEKTGQGPGKLAAKALLGNDAVDPQTVEDDAQYAVVKGSGDITEEGSLSQEQDQTDQKAYHSSLQATSLLKKKGLSGQDLTVEIDPKNENLIGEDHRAMLNRSESKHSSLLMENALDSLHSVDNVVGTIEKDPKVSTKNGNRCSSKEGKSTDPDSPSNNVPDIVSLEGDSAQDESDTSVAFRKRQISPHHKSIDLPVQAPLNALALLHHDHPDEDGKKLNKEMPGSINDKEDRPNEEEALLGNIFSQALAVLQTEDVSSQDHPKKLDPVMSLASKQISEPMPSDLGTTSLDFLVYREPPEEHGRERENILVEESEFRPADIDRTSLDHEHSSSSHNSWLRHSLTSRSVEISEFKPQEAELTSLDFGDSSSTHMSVPRRNSLLTNDYEMDTKREMSQYEKSLSNYITQQEESSFSHEGAHQSVSSSVSGLETESCGASDPTDAYMLNSDEKLSSSLSVGSELPLSPWELSYQEEASKTTTAQPHLRNQMAAFVEGKEKEEVSVKEMAIIGEDIEDSSELSHKRETKDVGSFTQHLDRQEFESFGDTESPRSNLSSADMADNQTEKWNTGTDSELEDVNYNLESSDYSNAGVSSGDDKSQRDQVAHISNWDNENVNARSQVISYSSIATGNAAMTHEGSIGTVKEQKNVSQIKEERINDPGSTEQEPGHLPVLSQERQPGESLRDYWARKENELHMKEAAELQRIRDPSSAPRKIYDQRQKGQGVKGFWENREQIHSHNITNANTKVKPMSNEKKGGQGH